MAIKPEDCLTPTQAELDEAGKIETFLDEQLRIKGYWNESNFRKFEFSPKEEVVKQVLIKKYREKGWDMWETEPGWYGNTAFCLCPLGESPNKRESSLFFEMFKTFLVLLSVILIIIVAIVFKKFVQQ